MINKTTQLFETVYQETSTVLQFEKRWSNGVGQFDHAVEGASAPHVKSGKIVKAITPGGRRLLIIGTKLGNVVVFERFSTGENNGNQVIYMNCSPRFLLGHWAQPGPVDLYDLETLINLKGGLNIGRVIEDLHSVLAVR